MSNAKTHKEDLTLLANFRDQSEKASWMRKKANLELLVKELEPINDEILRLDVIKNKIIDEIQAIRRVMMADCRHPKDCLVHCGTYIKCKFCESRLSIPKR